MDTISYALSKRYIDKTVEGLGSIKGQPCTIRSVTEKDNGTEIVFEWTGANGASETSTIFVKNGIDGKDGDDGISISKVEKINTVDLVDTYRITFSDNTFFDYSVTNGVQGIQGVKGEKGDQGEQGVQGVQGIKGDKGDDGYPFLIYKEYSDISEFNKNDFPEIGLMFMVKSDSTSSYPVYRYTGDTTTPYSHVTNLEAGQGIKGDKGDKGDTGVQGVAGENGKDGITYTPVIGTVVSGTTASASVTINDDTYTATFDFVIPKGDKGDAGECIVDDALSDTSENPVHNKVVKKALDEKADKAVATTNVDGLMSAEDKVKLDAFEITTTGGKLHDKDIATTDIIPDLSAYAKTADVPNIKVNSAVNADTVGEKSADDFPQIIDFGWNETDTKTAVGKSGKTTIYKCANWTDFPVGGTNGQGTLIAINFGGEGTAGIDSMWLIQLYIAAVNGIIYKRYVSHTMLNSWVEMYSGGDKPYVTGSATVAANSTTCTSNHGFTPSAVIWWDGNSSGVAIGFSETSFSMAIADTDDRTVNYLIFK